MPEPQFPARISEEIWDAKYRLKTADGTAVDARLDDTFWRVARAAASVEKGKKAREAWASRFHDALADFGFLPGGRIVAGAGTGREVTLFNCFVMGRIDDDLGSIFENVKEAALTMQQGGGIGHDFSTLRPKGALVRSIGADASGPVSFMDVWDSMCRTIMSAGARRGAMMGTLRCDHPDIEAFVDAKSDPARLRNFNVSVLITDAFMVAVKSDADWDLVFDGKVYRTVRAHALWDRIMRAAYDYAEPGVIFIDRVNARNNLAYCEEIHATNPCVPADTWVHTADGPRQVRDLLGRQFVARVQGQEHISGRAGFFRTGAKQLVRLDTAEGHTLRLTADHRLKRVSRISRHRMEADWCAAGDLRPGDLVVLNDHCAQPEWNGKFTAEQGYLLGLLVGDGTLKSDKAILSAWRPAVAVNGTAASGVDGVMDEALRAARTLPHRADFDGWQEVGGRNEYRLSLAALKTLAADIGMKPGQKMITSALEQGSSEFYRGFLRGFFDADGSVQGSQNKGVSVRLAQSDLPRLQGVQRMLLRLGVASSIYVERRPAAVRNLPDGRGGTASYATQPQHELIIAGENIVRFSELVGFADHEKAGRLGVAIASYRRAVNRERFVATVTSLTELGVEDVYDVEVPGINAFDANGFVAHNCGEQPLPAYGACLLGSINLARLVSAPFTPEAGLDLAKLEERVATAVRFLDNVIDISNYPLSAQRHDAKAKRRIGLGVTGLADALIMLSVRYGSERARVLAGEWMAAIERAAYLASAELAGEKGAFPLFDAERFLGAPNVAALPKEVRAAIRRHGIRNGCLISIAPAGTISLLAGNISSGIEPVFDYVFTRRVLEADGSAREEAVEDWAHALYRGRATKQPGTDTAPLPAAFVRAGELTPREHLEMQAALQPHVDSSISKTINCPAGISFEAFKGIYADAYDLGLKGCTVYRPNEVTGAVLTASAVAVAASEPPEVATRAGGIAEVAAEPVAPRPVPPARTVPNRQPPDRLGDVVYMSKPLEREPVLAGFTYKIKWPESEHALYVTINDIEVETPTSGAAPGQAGGMSPNHAGGVSPNHAGGVSPTKRRRPFEIFINTRNLEHYAWTVALTRMISAVFRRGGDVAFVAEELKAVFDPQGGRWISGRYVPSLLAAIGEVIEAHMIRIGFLSGEPKPLIHGGAPVEASPPGEDWPPQARRVQGARHCPRCSQSAYVKEGACWVCRACGFSRCG